MADLIRVSIDGPTASGKTTLGISLAHTFRGAFLDTGLTFRAATYALLHGATIEDLESTSWWSAIDHRPANFASAGSEIESTWLGDNEITDLLWSYEVDNSIDVVTRNSSVRQQILTLHQKIIEVQPTIFVAGRDVGTTLLTDDATLHIVLTAEFGTRRERRRLQYSQFPGRSVAVGATSAMDLTTIRLLQGAPNSIIVDTTTTSAKDVTNMVKHELDQRLK